MVVVRGAFNELLRPGLKEAWEAAYSHLERRTGVYDVLIGQPPKRDLRDTPYAEDEWPPKDWPNYP